MKHATDMLLLKRQTLKLYEQHLERIRLNYQLSQIEITMIGFLHNNPGKDTAADIAELRMLPKGNVSQGVESLVKKGLLRRNQDQTDRRKIHLSLEEKSLPILEEIKAANTKYMEQIFSGISEEELEMYEKINSQLVENVAKALERNINHDK